MPVKIFLFAVSLALPVVSAEDDKYIESEVISLIGKEGFELKSKDATFSFKPYILLQSHGEFNYVDDEGLGLADYDNIVNTGFGIPNAMVGFAGRSFKKITFNLNINAAKGGSPALMPQAWFDVNFSDALRFRMGKFKTPMFRDFGVRLGQKLFPAAPLSLTVPVNLPYNLNAVNPALLSGFDVGVQLHGIWNNRVEYQAALFNGDGILQNNPRRTTSDDFGWPSWLYTLRAAYLPFGPLPLHTGNPEKVEPFKLALAGAASYNIEANSESSNDLRYAGEITLFIKRLYLSLEGYYFKMDMTERQRTSPDFNFWGAYLQAGYLLPWGTQPAFRFEVMDRNSDREEGILMVPTVGLNQFIYGQSLKLQAMYQYLIKYGHNSEFTENDDDNGMSEHKGLVQVQFAF